MGKGSPLGANPRPVRLASQGRRVSASGFGMLAGKGTGEAGKARFGQFRRRMAKLGAFSRALRRAVGARGRPVVRGPRRGEGRS